MPALAVSVFLQQIDQFYFTDPAAVGEPHEEKRRAKEQNGPSHGIRIKPEPKFRGSCDRPQDKGCDDAGQYGSGQAPQKHRARSKEKCFPEKMLRHGPLFHAEDPINGKFPAALPQHIVVDIPDQGKKDSGYCQYSVPDRILKQGEGVVPVAVQNVVAAACQGEKGKKQGAADDQGKEIETIVPQCSSDIVPEKFSIHRSDLLPAW